MTTAWFDIQPNRLSQASSCAMKIYGSQQSTAMKTYTHCVQRAGDDNAMIRERQLRQLLLSDRNYRVLCAHGPGGMGKTAALEWLCRDEHVQERFTDGVHLLSFGEALQEADIIKQMRTCACDFGSQDVEKQLSVESCLSIAIRRFGTMFRGRTFLVVIDDAWNVWKHVVELFRNVVLKEGTRCSMVISCRTSETEVAALCDEKVSFAFLVPTSQLSQEILLSRLGDEEKKQVVEWKEEHKDCRRLFENVLRECGGWILCLSIASAILQSELKTYGKEGDPAIVFCEWEASVSNESELTDETMPEYEGNLRKLVQSGLKRTQVNMKNQGSSESVSSLVAEKFLALCVLPKQKTVPESMLNKQWNFRKDAVRRTVSALEAMSLLNVTAVRGKGRFVKVNDNIIDLCGEMAVENNGEGAVGAYHQQLLESFASASNIFEEQYNGSYRAWWDHSGWGADNEQVRYLHHNLLRHFLAADLLEEACAVLLDPRWTVKQMRTGGIRQVLDDYEMVTAFVRSHEESTEFYAGHRTELLGRIEALDLIKEAVSLASQYLSRNEKEVWFQLHGRLIGSKAVAGIDEYLEKIMVHAEKPWIQSETEGLLQAGGTLKNLWTFAAAIEDASFEQYGSVVLVSSRKGLERHTFEIRKFQEHDVGEGTVIWKVECEAGTIQGLLNIERRKVALLMYNGGIKVCDIERKTMLSCKDLGQNGERRCMTFCQNGSVLAFVSDDKGIEVWKTEGMKICMIREVQCDEEVVCLGLSGNGRTLAVGFNDGRVDVWDIDNGSLEGWFVVDSYIELIACSCDGRIATVSRAGPISVWSVRKEQTKEEANIRLKDWILWGMAQMQWSPDGRMLGILNDGEIRLLNVCRAPQEIMCACFECDLGSVGTLKWSTDGTQIVVCGRTTVLVLRVGLMRWTLLRESSEADTDSVSEDEEVKWTKVQWSGDGRMMATCSSNGQHVWLRDSHGKRLPDCELEWDQGELGLVRDLVWASERALLAVACDKGVVLWDKKLRERVALLPVPAVANMEHQTVKSIALSANGASAVVAIDAFTESYDLPIRHLVCYTSSSPSQLPLATHAAFKIQTQPSHRYGLEEDFKLACSDNGLVACEMQNVVLVYDCDAALRGRLRAQRPVRALSFDAPHKVLIEWRMGGSDHQPQFSSWSWQQQQQQHAAPESLRNAFWSSYNRGLYDGHHSLLGTLDERLHYDQFDYDYSASANAFAVVHDGSLHIYHVHS